MTNSSFKRPIDDRYFEDYVPGSVYEFGSIAVSKEEIISFASRYDPQTIHTDPETAEKGPFRGLIASGWHSCALAMRLVVDHYLSHIASLGSPGVRELRWTEPLRPNDVLSIRVTVIEARKSLSKLDRGIIRSFIELLNQNGKVVMTLESTNFLLCREENQNS